MDTRIGVPAAQMGRAAWAGVARRLRSGLAGAALAAVAVGLLPAGTALATTVPPAAPAQAAATSPAHRPAPRAGHAPPPGPGPQISPGVRALCGPARPGYASCLALVRTDLKARTALAAANGAPLGYGPADLKSAYRLPSGSAGAGQTVAIVDAYDDPVAAQDLAVYRAKYHLPPCTAANGCFRKVAQDGSTSYPYPSGDWAGEISTDLDMVSAVCPNCHILLVEANSNSIDDLGAAVNEAVALGARYVSNSYGAVTSPSFPAALQARADALYYSHPGVAITAASGDYGYDSYLLGLGLNSPGDGLNYPAASPDVTAVGGTTLTRDSSTPRGWTETTWAGVGSGCSAEPKPSWQKDTGCAGRTVADVSALADPGNGENHITGAAVYDSYNALGSNLYPGWAVVGGTSVASPVIASAYALAGAPTAAASPVSYPYADPSALNDITSGTNSSDGCSPAYLCTAGPGYDGPTGLGTPNGVAAFKYGPHGPHGDLAGVITDSATGKPVAGALVSAGGFAAVTDAAGRYDLATVPGRLSVTASAYAHQPKTVSGVTVTAGQTQTENFALAAAPMTTVSGTVSDGSGQGWPLYAKVSVPGTPVVTYTDPVTGHYRLSLPAGASYTVQADPVYAGYQQDSQPVTVGTAPVTQNLAATVDPLACAAPGYHPAQVLSETFDKPTEPAGWSVVNKRTDPTNTWRFDAPDGGINFTGGSGNYALAYWPNSNAAPDEELITPAMNMSADAAVSLSFLSYAETSALRMSVELSTDGGHTWSTVWVSTAADGRLVELPTAAHKPSVKLMFRVTGPVIPVGPQNIGLQLDNVLVTNCAPSSGGLVVGTVGDANTGQGVDGATITGPSGVTATSMAVPGDPAHAHGFYALSAPAGTQQLTAAAPGYAAGSATVRVTGGRVGTAGVKLKAGQVSLSGPVSASAVLGGKATATITVRNSGSAPATVNFDPRPGGFIPATAGGGRAAAGYPVRLIHGRFRPRPDGLAGLAAAQRRADATAPAWSDNSPWVRLADAPSALWGAAAAADPATGKVYVAGGARDPGNANGASVFDPSTGRWSTLAALPYGRELAQAVFIGGKQYVTGGFDAGNNYVEIYNPVSGTWSTGATEPHDYVEAAAVALNGKMYVIGGCDPAGICGQSDVQVYDPVTDHWSAAADYPIPVSYANCGAIAGKIYCAGGWSDTQGQTAAGYVYDPATNKWTPIADMPTAAFAGNYGAADGKLLISTGAIDQGAALTNQGWAYDPASSTWSALPNQPQPEFNTSSSACGFYVIGGGFSSAAWQLPGYGGCGGQSWLTASPATTIVNPGQTVKVTITLNAGDPSISQPGTYTASFRAGNSTPYGAATVPVTFTVKPPASWGKLAGRITGTTCSGKTRPLPGASVDVSSGHTTWPLGTDSGGHYAQWLDTARNPFTLIASLAGWRPQAAQVKLEAQATTTRNFTLSQICG